MITPQSLVGIILDFVALNDALAVADDVEAMFRAHRIGQAATCGSLRPLYQAAATLWDAIGEGAPASERERLVEALRRRVEDDLDVQLGPPPPPPLADTREP
jgi:HPt (histidine-containing phosphotransfer) domain-containing protein